MDRLETKLTALVEGKPPEKISSAEVESIVAQLIRSEEFRKRAIEIHKSGQRRNLVAALMVIIGGIMIIGGMILTK